MASVTSELVVKHLPAHHRFRDYSVCFVIGPLYLHCHFLLWSSIPNFHSEKRNQGLDHHLKTNEIIDLGLRKWVHRLGLQMICRLQCGVPVFGSSSRGFLCPQ